MGVSSRYDECVRQRKDDIERLKNEMEELFADLCQVPRLVPPRRGFRPRLDVYRVDDPPTVVVLAELAGVDPTGVEIALAGGELVIAGARRRAGKTGAVYQQMEIDYGRFERRIALEERVDAERVEATYDRGLLTVVLPLAPRRGPVAVRVEPRGRA